VDRTEGRIGRYAAVALVMFVVTAACGSPSTTGDNPPSASEVGEVERRPAEDTSGQQFEVATRPPLPIDALLYAAGSVLRGTVDGPFWNQADGQRWELTESDFTPPDLYREVQFDVTEVLRDDVGVEPGRIVIRVRGGGSGAETTDSAPFGGTFIPGEDVYILVTLSAYFMREGPIDVFQPLDQSGGVFHASVSGVLDRDLFSGGSETIDESEFLRMLQVSRVEDRPEWDRYRFPLTAAIARERIDRDLSGEATRDDEPGGEQ